MTKRELYVFPSVLQIVVAEVDYCTRSCHKDGTEVKHIACNNSGEFSSSCDPGFKVAEMTKSMQQLILHELNALRNFVAGGGNCTHKFKPACRMATIQWDDELAKNSGLFIKKCNETNYCHGTDDFPNSGYMASNYHDFPKNTSATDFLKQYFSLMNPLFLKNREIFVDLFADRNIRLGCTVIFRYKEDGKIQYQSLFAFSTDIQAGESIYTECETAATGCKKRNDKYTNLCSVDEVYEH